MLGKVFVTTSAFLSWHWLMVRVHILGCNRSCLRRVHTKTEKGQLVRPFLLTPAPPKAWQFKSMFCYCCDDSSSRVRPECSHPNSLHSLQYPVHLDQEGWGTSQWAIAIETLFQVARERERKQKKQVQETIENVSSGKAYRATQSLGSSKEPLGAA